MNTMVNRDFRLGAALFVATLVAWLALLLWFPTAWAADLRLPPNKAPGQYEVYSWAGFYLEGYGLYAANTTDADVAMNSVPIVNIATSPHGPGVGGAVGYNFQPGYGAVVIGIRADLAWANINGGGGLLPASGGFAVSNATNWLGDVNLLLGLPLSPDGRLLGYVNGGFAFGGAKPNLQVSTLSQGINDTSTGWNIGAGLKYALTPNWSIGIEGDYYQLGDKQVSIPIGATDVLTSNNKFHIFEQKVVATLKF